MRAMTDARRAVLDARLDARLAEDVLYENLNPRVRLPRGFLFWHKNMQLAWLRQNQQGAGAPEPTTQPTRRDTKVEAWLAIKAKKRTP